ncbi:hypothetical protein PMI16_00429 [Herbaspirillum sp. CF444]|uniref:hypothetical protein n=1 Tax=Herbaspirillum sp. CF444 TaxID=1144319 RepID=UPI000272686A|nr:hypothetical protein [Herbaspirillum sp. CF444]EJL94074.1 hypothetical protein PMI16_00429 [Herbaspirillum sp. CF444]
MPNINDVFADAVTDGGTRAGSGTNTSFKDLSSKSNTTHNVRVFHRTGSYTDLHMHGNSMGTASHHSVRSGTVTTIKKSQMNKSTKDYVRQMHGK